MPILSFEVKHDVEHQKHRNLKNVKIKKDDVKKKYGGGKNPNALFNVPSNVI